MNLKGLSRRDALRLAKHLGFEIRQPHASGEIIIYHPEIREGVRLNGRRKDIPRSLAVALGKASRSVGA